jgi:EpsD family peptidyl-prolyl cis-trans isomerase
MAGFDGDVTAASRASSSVDNSNRLRDGMGSMMWGRISAGVVWLSIALLSGCGNSGGSKPATQVAVKVNDGEISVHQVNALLARVPATGLTPEQQMQVRKRVVDELVDQQLLIERSLQAKLDRDPEVLAALESSRRQILSQAYIQKKIGATAKPADDDIQRYFDANPALFSQRKAYRLQELATNIPTERLPDLDNRIKASKSLEDVAEWLQRNGYQFAARSAVRGAEQLPLAALPKVAEMRNGEMAAFVNDDRVTILQVVDTQAQPLNEKEAAPYIEQFLTNTKREELLKAELKQLRQTAKIEYVGDLADASSLTSTGKGGGAAGSEQTKAAKPTAEAAVDKGVRGLR